MEAMSDAVVDRTLPTVYEWHAQQVEAAAKNLAYWMTTTPEDKLSWCPKAEGQPGEGRCIYDQIHECAQVNRRIATLLTGGTPGDWVKDWSYKSSQEAADDLKASASEFASVIRGLDDGALNRVYKTGMGDMTGALCLEIALGNMYYHGGQINLIQLLLGDTEFHFPKEAEH